jgi:hypothetical protein
MTELERPLAAVSVLIVDMSDTAPKVQEGFASAGAHVILVTDQRSFAEVEPSFIPKVAVIYPRSIDDRRIRHLGLRMVDEPKCVSILYDDDFPEDQYRDDDMIHRSRPIEDVIAAAISELRKRTETD